MTDKNETKALPDYYQKIFLELYGLSGSEYQEKLSEARVKWVRKVKLTNDITKTWQ